MLNAMLNASVATIKSSSSRDECLIRKRRFIETSKWDAGILARKSGKFLVESRATCPTPKSGEDLYLGKSINREGHKGTRREKPLNLCDTS
jgi:hypothetical protein